MTRRTRRLAHILPRLAGGLTVILATTVVAACTPPTPTIAPTVEPTATSASTTVPTEILPTATATESATATSEPTATAGPPTAAATKQSQAAAPPAPTKAPAAPTYEIKWWGDPAHMPQYLECTKMFWEVTGAKEVYLRWPNQDEQKVDAKGRQDGICLNEGERVVFTLRVVKPDGSQEVREMVVERDD